MYLHGYGKDGTGRIYKRWKDKKRVKQRENKARNRGKKGESEVGLLAGGKR